MQVHRKNHEVRRLEAREKKERPKLIVAGVLEEARQDSPKFQERVRKKIGDKSRKADHSQGGESSAGPKRFDGRRSKKSEQEQVEFTRAGPRKPYRMRKDGKEKGMR